MSSTIHHSIDRSDKVRNDILVIQIRKDNSLSNFQTTIGYHDFYI